MKMMNKILKVLLPLILLSTFSCKKYRMERFAGSNSKITAHDILSDDKYKELLVEIAYEGNHPPNADAVVTLKSFVAGHVYKPDGITFEYNPIPDQGKQYYSIEDLDN